MGKRNGIVKVYLENLPEWDGIARVDNLLRSVLGSEYTWSMMDTVLEHLFNFVSC